MAVNEIAISIGKKIQNTGTSNVPKPKPENNVNPEPRNAIRQIIK